MLKRTRENSGFVPKKKPKKPVTPNQKTATVKISINRFCVYSHGIIKHMPGKKISLPTVHISDKIEDIIKINKKSVYSKERKIRIIELSTLSNLIPPKTAENIRRGLVEHGVKVLQLTNQRVFEPWTKVRGFVKKCMNIRYLPIEILPIQTEVLIFDNTVAVYQVNPAVSVTVINQPAFASQQKALFDGFWKNAKPMAVSDEGSTTMAVTIKRKPEDVFNYISKLANWPEFSDFAANFEKVNDNEYLAHTSQGDIRVVALFDRKRLLLDTQCILPDGEIQTIPYRVVPNRNGSELIMTNFKPIKATKSEYEEQLYWMEIELKKVKEILENEKNF